MELSVNGRIWLESNKGVYIGKGRIKLLEEIKKHGSISNAAKAMKMSYRQAWEEIDIMNKQSKIPLVIKISGGVGGGGSCLTEEGEKVIDVYRKTLNQFKQFINQHS